MNPVILFFVLMLIQYPIFSAVNGGTLMPIASLNFDQKQQVFETEKDQYRGNPITLNFQDIRVSAVLQVLANFTGINIVVSDKVKGTISLHLTNIPWDQALDIILKTRSLSKRKIGNVMLIAPVEDILAQEKKEVKAEAELKKLAVLHSDQLQINYAKALDVANLLKDQTSNFLSPRGSLSVDPRTNIIWVQDIKKHLFKIKDFVRHIDIPVKQVLIEARIVNASKDFARDLGVRFGLGNNEHLKAKLRDKPQNSNASGDLPLADRLNIDLAALPLTASPATIGIALAKLGNGVLLDLELSALESEGKGEIVASPRLITTDQHTALIESGEDIPYQEATLSGATAVAFKKAVLSLKVTPQITANSKILLNLQISQDLPSVKVFNGVPSILTKEIETTVLSDDGETIVLGGIYKRDKYNAVNRVPFLGELPLIGRLFGNKATIIKNEELLIFITPRIISQKESA